MPVELKVSLREDRSAADVTFPTGPTPLAAGEIEGLIGVLVGLRAAVLPPMPNTNPAPNTSLVPAVRWYVAGMASGDAQVCLLVPGIGWVGVILNKTGAAELAGLLELHVQGRRPN